MFLALAAGFVSFVSPCCLPLVPGYLAAISGGTALEPGERPRAGLMVRALVFVGTFSAGLHPARAEGHRARLAPVANQIAARPDRGRRDRR